MNEEPLVNKKVKSRKGIAMIELIFAIVIIGITLLSVPNLIYQASESGYTTIQQESIAAAASDLSLILSREWDEVGTSDEFHTPILTTNSDGNSTSTRPGARSRSFFTGIGGPYPASDIGDIGADDGDIDDIDDLHNIPVTVIGMSGAFQDLIDINITIATNVNYIEDDTTPSGDWNTTAPTFNFPTGIAGGSSNIKKITITLTTNSSAVEISDKKIVFNAFSSNIGSYKLERRELP
jgi:hypothetical protein